jgi:threonine aldolase
MSRIEEILDNCTHILPGHGESRTLKAILQELADSLDGAERPDNYGEGGYMADFEAEIAGMFGKEAAVFMPSGTMAQQIALRIWCRRSGNYTVAMHPTAHPEFAERSGFRFLHSIQRLQFGAPEFAGRRLLSAHDFQDLGQEPGVILLELPYRPLGGQLPDWDELLAIKSWADERDIPLHLDGARIWQCRPFYQKSYQEIADLFDSVYVSFYKDIGGLCGAALMGTSSFVEESRVWQIRHGGRLKTMGPYLVSARLGLKQVLPQIDQWVDRAREVAAILASHERVAVKPDPPHVNFFQIFIRGSHEALNERHLALAEESGTFVFYRLRPAEVPGIAITELHCWENALRFDLSLLEPFLERLLA